MIFIILVIVLSMAITIVRAALGPTAYDRILAVNVFGTLTVVFIVLLSEFLQAYDYVDVALVYGLINFIATIALLKYFRYGSFNDKENE